MNGLGTTGLVLDLTGKLTARGVDIISPRLAGGGHDTGVLQDTGKAPDALGG